METGHRPHRSLHRIRKNSGCARIEADGIRKSGGRKRGAARDRTCSPSLANRIYICWRAQRSEKSKPDETLRSSVQLRKEGEEEVLLGGQDKEDLPPLTRRELFVNLKLSRLEIGQSIHGIKERIEERFVLSSFEEDANIGHVIRTWLREEATIDGMKSLSKWALARKVGLERGI